MLPSSPRGWLNWAVSVSDRYQFPHSPQFEYTGRTDPRVDDRRESAISVKMALERATAGNGAGKLLMDYYVGEASWFAFTETERYHLEAAIKKFRRELQAAGFLPDER